VTRLQSDSGFTLIELLVGTGLLLMVCSIVTTALMQITKHQQTVWNRTEMHSGIRGATELLQQEVGQAGRIAARNTVSLGQPINPVGGAAPAASAACSSSTPASNAVTVPVSSVSGLFATSGTPSAHEILTTLDGDNQESIWIASIDHAVSPPTITACFTKAHESGTVLVPMGGFATGVIPPTGIANGSTGSVLKIYGDINSDGDMVYVEYTCDTVAHNLYRNVVPLNLPAGPGAKPAVTASHVLLSNIIDNPGGTECFTYQTSTISIGSVPVTFVLDVAVTLTVQTQQMDPVTRAYQTETKALLNVSPRNVFNTWEYAAIGYTDRIQPTPEGVTNLLP
jgi:type II secretory pathway pseudopilin PulG